MHLTRKLRKDTALLFGAVVLLAIVTAALMAPLIAPVDPNALNILARLSTPSGEHWLGTDHLGRDLLSRLLYGARYSLGIAFGAVALGTAMGVTVGILAGVEGGLWESVGMRVVDALMTYPTVLIALFFVATLGSGTDKIILALALATMPQSARVARAQALKTRELAFVEAARALGASRGRIIVTHILLNSLGPIIVALTYDLGRVLLAESTLGFLGLGADTATWGQIVGDGRQYMREAPWAILFGGAAIALTVLAFNLVGDSVRDAVDPRVS